MTGGPIDPAEVRRLHEQGMSVRAIAKQVNASYGGVHKALAKLRVTMRSRGYRSAPPEPPPCGTKWAYQRHLDHGEEPDEACAQANRDSAADYDSRTGYSKARNRAYRRLADMAPDVFDVFRAEEEAKARDETGGDG